ncbi:AraC family transcriptional regulator [Sphingomonas sp.]|uniref:helix-turn-helix domain-containing protein n=1 Tax=Sphingomonas sp. TaxID=28214 RepID=UPI0017E450B2|nr:AraC family transcriptional regulator [Sphingomonas sp.]MBA4760510.1 helix-turn-helix transcriptional regulator [Sphingomonas sp.]
MLINAAAVGAGSVGFAAVALLAHPIGFPKFSQALLGLLGILTVDAASSTFDMSPLMRLAPQWVGASYLFWPWIPVLLWSYVDGLTAPAASPRVQKWRPNTLAACLGMVLYAPTFLLSGADKLALADGTLRPATFHHAMMALGLLGFVLIWIGQMLVSLHQIARRLVAHRQRVRDLLSDVAAVDLRWIDGFGVFIGMGMLLAVADNLSGVILGYELLNSTTGALFEATVIAGLAMFGVTQKSAVPDFSREAEHTQFEPLHDGPADVAADDFSALASQSDAARYARSSLTGDDCRNIIARLDQVMTRQEPWRDPFLNLKMLSELVATKPYYVTQALNTVLERNFYDYVNGWRARAAAAALQASDASVLSICEDVGFNSKSTFNSAFRKEIGVTPTAYRKSGA